MREHQQSERTDTEMPIDLYTIHKLKQFVGTNDNFSTLFKEIILDLDTTDVYCPIQINDYFVASQNRFVIHNAINKLKKDGFPSVMKNYEIFYFRLPSEGPHSAIHFIWKQPLNDKPKEQQKLIDKVCRSRNMYYNRLTKREIKEKLEHLDVIKPHIAELLMRRC